MSAGFVCVQPDTASSGCLEWAQAWSLLDLPIEDAMGIAAAILVIWAMAWGFRLLLDFLLNRSR